MKNRIAAFVSLMLLASPALAATTIVNLDTIPYDLEVAVAGTPQMVSIDPNRKWTTDSYPTYVRIKGRSIRLEANSEYAIWKGGTFTKQRHATTEGSHR